MRRCVFTLMQHSKATWKQINQRGSECSCSLHSCDEWGISGDTAWPFLHSRATAAFSFSKYSFLSKFQILRKMLYTKCCMCAYSGKHRGWKKWQSWLWLKGFFSLFIVLSCSTSTTELFWGAGNATSYAISDIFTRGHCENKISMQQGEMGL